MLRSGTAGPWLLPLLCALACGDRVIVARGLSLVSAAQSSDDAGFGELGFEGLEPAPADAGVDAADGGTAELSDAGQPSPGAHPASPAFPLVPRGEGHGAAHDKEPKVDKPGELERDAGHGSFLGHD